MKRFIALFAILIVAMIGAATASANGGGEGAGKVKQFCLVNTQTTVTAWNKKEVKFFNFLVWKGYATKGACADVPAPAVTPQIDREGSCTVVGNQFENVDANQLAQGSYLATDGSTVAIVPADFVEGVGLTCDVPSGDVYAGYDVADNFGGVEGFVDTAAPQFNFYPYYVVKA